MISFMKVGRPSARTVRTSRTFTAVGRDAAGNVVAINPTWSVTNGGGTIQVGSSATLGTGSAFQGNILALASITVNDNVTLIGRALARNGAVTLGTNDTIILP